MIDQISDNSLNAKQLQAQVHYDKGEYKESIELCRQMTRLKPKESDWAKKLLEVIIGALNKTISSNPEDYQAWENRGAAKYCLCREAEAKRDCEEAIRLNRGSDFAWWYLGSAKFFLGSYEESVQDLNEAIELNPQNSWAWARRGAAKRMLDRDEEATRDCEEAIRLNPHNELAWANLGDAKRFLGHYEEAIKAFNEAVKLNPNDGWTYGCRAEAHLKLGHDEEAMDDFLRSLELNPHDHDVKAQLDELKNRLGIFGLAQYYHSRQKFDETIIYTTRAIQETQDKEKSKTLYEMRAISYGGLENYTQALRDIKAALKLDPDDPEALCIFGRIKLATKDLKEAEKILRLSIKKKPDFFQSWFFLGQVYFTSGTGKENLKDLNNAINTFNKATKLDPSDAGAWQYLGESKLELYEDKMKKKKYGKSEAQKNKKKKDEDKILEHLNAAVRLNPNNWRAWRSRGVAKVTFHRYEEAVEDLQQVLVFRPNDEDVQRLLAEINPELPPQASAPPPGGENTIQYNLQPQPKPFVPAHVPPVMGEQTLQNYYQQLQPPNHAVVAQNYWATLGGSEIVLCEEKDRGGMGIVYRALWQNVAVAVKVSLGNANNSPESEKALTALKAEYNTLSALEHPNIIRVYGDAIGSDGRYGFVMDFYTNSLSQYLFEQHHPVEDRINCALHVAKGLAYLHGRTPVIIHRDLKTGNVLVKKDHEGKDLVVLTDFGTSLKLIEQTHQDTKTAMGTVSHFPPEILSPLNGIAQYRPSCDMFSFAVLLRTCLAEEVPYKGWEPIAISNFVLKQENNRLDIPNAVATEIPRSSKLAKDADLKLAKLIKGCWQTKPDKRPTAEYASRELEEIHKTVVQARK
jgi:tetratricopeptide (TPR) repeat protein